MKKFLILIVIYFACSNILFANEDTEFIELKPGSIIYNDIAENWNKAIEFHYEELTSCIDANFSRNEQSFMKVATCIYTYLSNKLKSYNIL